MLSARHCILVVVLFQIGCIVMVALWLLRAKPPFIVTTQSKARFSSHMCVGELYQDDSWKYKSCHLRYVCWNGDNITYFADSTDRASVPAPGELSVSISPLGVTNPPIRFEPALALRMLPDNVIWAHDIDQTDLHVLAVEYNGSNFGHVLGDSLLPWWRLLDMFGLISGDAPFRPINMIIDPPFTYSCAWQVREKWLPDMAFCERLYEKITEPFTYRSMVYLQKHYDMARPDRPVCFKNLVVGIGMLSDHGQDHSVHGRYPDAPADLHLIGGGSILWKFRNLYMERIGLLPDTKPTRGKHDVVFVDRSSQHRSWYDTRKAYEALQARFGQDGFNIVEPIDFSQLPIQEQIKIVSTTQVLLCFPGGSSYISMFLPRGATLICIFALSELSDGRQDFPLHNNMAHINVKWVQGEQQGDNGEVFYNMDRLQEEVEHVFRRQREH